ncbi:Hsp20/alpha crystallin family protein [Caldimonas caldifontis]|uniref:Heat-shock protein n=1 Tax=Caldimonas caldifontis TaxID=1452508 RepID=A0A2S5SVD4_9BURK|nr:Hsp20/alpha crystallin family protein [Caldimonas caldifontis]PPE66705.1 heat-shock protein [Caldimonas caldifontis]
MNTTTAVTAPADTPARATPAERRDPALVPPVDVIEDSSGITLYADLPGVPKERLNLRVEGDTLSVEGEMQLGLPQDMSPSHAEVQLSRFRRTFTLSKELDADKVSAELTHGVLRVRIPKAEHAQPRRIEVRVG